MVVLRVSYYIKDIITLQYRDIRLLQYLGLRELMVLSRAVVLMIPVEFCGDLWQQKTRVPGLSCAVVRVILRLAVLVEHRFN